jgi:hypothetical protein
LAVIQATLRNHTKRLHIWRLNTFVTQIEDTIEYAAAGQTPYMAPRVIANAYTLVYNTGLFPDACREWRHHPAAKKNWTTFKIHFSKAHNDYRLTQNTAQTSGYHTANNVMEGFVNDTANALANLATVTASDRAMMAELIKTNTELLCQLAAHSKELQTLRTQLATQAGNNTGNQTSSRNNRSTCGKVCYNNNENYCWTHGWDVADSHKSDSCTNPGNGHKTKATRANTMGGSSCTQALVM